MHLVYDLDFRIMCSVLCYFTLHVVDIKILLCLFHFHFGFLFIIRNLHETETNLEFFTAPNALTM